MTLVTVELFAQLVLLYLFRKLSQPIKIEEDEEGFNALNNSESDYRIKEFYQYISENVKFDRDTIEAIDYN